QPRPHPRRRAHRNRRLQHHHAPGRQHRPHLGHHRPHRRHISLPIRPHRRGHAHEHHLRIGHRRSRTHHERQPPRRQPLGHQLRQPRLGQPHPTPRQLRHLARIHIAAHHPMPQRRQARPRRQPHIPRAHHNDPPREPVHLFLARTIPSSSRSTGELLSALAASS